MNNFFVKSKIFKKTLEFLAGSKNKYVVMDQVSKTWVLEVPWRFLICVFKASWTRLFFIYCQKFWHFWWFFKVECTKGPLQNFKKSSNVPKIWQKMKKSLVQHAFSSILHGSSELPIVIYHNSKRFGDIFFSETSLYVKCKKISVTFLLHRMEDYSREAKWLAVS